MDGGLLHKLESSLPAPVMPTYNPTSKINTPNHKGELSEINLVLSSGPQGIDFNKKTTMVDTEIYLGHLYKCSLVFKQW